VVVEEPKAPEIYRKVLLFVKPNEDCVATYISPIQPFQPSDVCFYLLGGQRMLLVTDEINDAIHVVKVDRSGFQFQRFLVPGCPILVQPTAMTLDLDTHRLWVACRGGKIIFVDPKAPEDTTLSKPHFRKFHITDITELYEIFNEIP
jgi:hypothetical protein